MNVLAHQLLSGNDDEIKIGNAIGDWVRGRDYENYPQGIKKGILLHRKIDHFTDSHHLVTTAVNLLRPTVGRYAPVAIDVLFDYLIARNWQQYNKIPLALYNQRLYQLLMANKNIPSQAQSVFAVMIREDWLTKYATEAGIRQSLNGLHRRVKFENNLDKAMDAFLNNESAFEQLFNLYWPQLCDAVNNWLLLYA